MTILKYAAAAIGGFAFAIALTQTELWAGQAASRFPKGIPGLAEGHEGAPGSNWLLGAKDDAERFRRLQIFAGGTDQQMWQVGYRYEQVYHAIQSDNWDMGVYQWGKLRDVLNVALMKRPNRTPNAEAMFLDANWPRLEAALKSKDRTTARDLFVKVEREACMQCHVAEGMPWLNDQALFRNTASFAN